jgi:hypothetical protein
LIIKDTNSLILPKFIIFSMKNNKNYWILKLISDKKLGEEGAKKLVEFVPELLNLTNLNLAFV